MHKNLKKIKLIILLPLYNDWENLNILLKKFKKTIKSNIKIIIVNDCSTLKRNIVNKFFDIEILDLSKNLGSQRAIALGLRYIQKKYLNYNFTLIMDSDGQDDPKTINKLLKLFNPKKDEILVVQRTNRKENLLFRFLYKIYKLAFTILTWKSIKFGNFSLINNKSLKKIVNNEDIWAAYPAAVIKNLKKIKKINADRQRRFKGNTKMNYYKLLDHAFRVFLVFKKNILFISIFYLYLVILNFKNYTIHSFIIFFILNFALFVKSFLNAYNFKKTIKTVKITIDKN